MTLHPVLPTLLLAAITVDVDHGHDHEVRDRSWLPGQGRTGDQDHHGEGRGPEQQPEHDEGEWPESLVDADPDEQVAAAPHEPEQDEEKPVESRVGRAGRGGRHRGMIPDVGLAV
jgi:hypothetical protein